MVSLGDLARRGAILVLAALHAREPILMKDFVSASEVHFQSARQLRADLEVLGLITTEEVPDAGRKEVHIRLTPLGRRVARHFAAAAAELEKK